MENDNSESKNEDNKNEDNKIMINKIISNDDIKNDDIMIRSIASSKKVSKKKSEYIMPTKENYSILLKVNYTIKQLKEIANHYKIKIGSVNKTHIIEKIYNYFKLYDNAVIIQNAWRRYLLKTYNKLRGPALFKRNLCVNDTDFFTMDNIVDIPFSQFYSFKDADNTIYGFDIMSIYNLFNRQNEKVSNPYNRNIFLKSVKKNMLKLIRLSKVFKEKIQLKINDTTSSDSNTIVDNDMNNNMNNSNETFLQNIDDRIFSVFHDIDILGNYTQQQWFTHLTNTDLIRFIYELHDIWSYRANLSPIVKNEICPNHHDLFRMIHIIDLRIALFPILQDIALTIIEKLVRSGINHDSKCLGANYVLCALTLVSSDAATAIPWLFQSVF